jgi:hypothetical protein
MALQKTTVSVAMGEGIDTKVDPYQIALGKLARLENSVFTTGKKLRKRNGTKKLASQLTNPRMLTSFDGELLAADDHFLYSYNEASDSLTQKGTLRSAVMSKQSIVRTTVSQTNADAAVNTGMTCFVWEVFATGVFYSIQDNITGQIVVSGAQLSTGQTPRVFALGTSFVIAFAQAAAYYYVTIPLATLTPGTQNLIDSGTTPFLIDGTVITSGAATQLCLAYGLGTNIKYRSLSTALVLSSAVVIATDLPTKGLGTWSNGTDFVVGYTTSSKAAFSVVSFGGSVIQNSVTIDGSGSGFGAITGSGTTVFYNKGTSVLLSTLPSYVPTAATLLYSAVALSSQAFTFSGDVYVGLFFPSSLQSTYFISDSSGYIAARFLSASAGDSPGKFFLPSISSLSPTKFLAPFLELSTSETTGVDSLTWDFYDPDYSYIASELGDNLHISGACLQMYDGKSLIEHGFNVYPEGMALYSAPFGGAIAPGTYQYLSTYEWQDNKGQVHRSATSLPVQPSNDTASNPSRTTSGDTGAAGTTTRTLGDLAFTSTTTAGSNILPVSAAAASQMYPGCKITSADGTTIQPNTYITAVGSTTITISIPAYASTTQAAMTCEYHLLVTGSTTAQSATVALGNVTQIQFFGMPVSGSATMAVSSTLGIQAGQVLSYPGVYFPGGATVLSIDTVNSTVTMSAAAFNTATYPVVFFEFITVPATTQLRVGMTLHDIGTFSTGTITLTGVIAPDAITINGIQYGFTSSSPTFPYEVDGSHMVHVGANNAATAQNLADAINKPYFGAALQIATQFAVGESVTINGVQFIAVTGTSSGTTFTIGATVADSVSNLAVAINATAAAKTTALIDPAFTASLLLTATIPISYSCTSPVAHVSLNPPAAFNNYDAGVVATVSNNVVTVTSKVTGVATNYTWAPNRPGQTASAHIALSPSTALSGGQDGVVVGEAVITAIDNAGNITLDQKATASISGDTFIVSNTFAVRADVAPLVLTAKSGVKQVLYRTTDNGATFFKVSSLDNDPTKVNQSFFDQSYDNLILANGSVYTTGGTVSDFPAPPCSTMANYDNRIFLRDDTNRGQVWLSKQVVPGQPVEFSNVPAFIFNVDPAGGDVTALSRLEDKLIFWKSNNILPIVGTGPADNGLNSSLTPPLLLPVDGGCSEPKSIVTVPTGQVFKSPKGIFLYTRKNETTYLGVEVESFNGNRVTSAYLAPGTTQIRLGLDNGQTLMHDYLYNQWGLFTNYDSIANVLFGGVQTFLGSDGWIRQETPGVFNDAGSYISQYIETGWLAVAGVQGFQRAYWFVLLGNFLSDHVMNIGIAYNYIQAFDQFPIQATQLGGDVWGRSDQWGTDPVFGGSAGIYQWRVFFSQQKTESFKLFFRDTQIPGDMAGEGYSLSGLNIEIAGKKGTWRPAANTSV